MMTNQTKMMQDQVKSEERGRRGVGAGRAGGRPPREGGHLGNRYTNAEGLDKRITVEDEGRKLGMGGPAASPRGAGYRPCARGPDGGCDARFPTERDLVSLDGFLDEARSVNGWLLCDFW